MATSVTVQSRGPGQSGKRSRLQQGFTLIEVMVALAIFAVVSVALIRSATMGVRQATILENRTLAWWLAENEMTGLRLQPRSSSSTGVRRKDASMAGRNWTIETRYKDTGNEALRQVEITVYISGEGHQPAPQAQLLGFLGGH